jgi:hypothetical protein
MGSEPDVLSLLFFLNAQYTIIHPLLRNNPMVGPAYN